ncbi:RmlD substrate binding domain protein [Marinobacterium sp. xm-d-579]|uniref:NAD-dependent epimerase/dehydratase family protein n=1 Tax=Marinobacterium sp. xm-d-579 TaxID=2497734 RepID=UPI0015697250|nr:RmlD substrate binding domain protein [Marinobacterium sp. xm-d-579]
MSKRFLIIGCGDLGNTIATKLISQQHKVYGLRRNIDQLSEGVQPIACDFYEIENLPPLPEVDYVIFSAAAKSRDIEHYRQIYVDAPAAILKALPTAPIRSFVVSSTGVYAQNRGEWIDEFSAAEPNTAHSVLLLEGESQFKQRSACTLIRSSGIYGPGRTHLLKRILSGTIALETPTHFSNRIHSDDLADFVVHLIGKAIDQQPLQELYLASDGHPAPIHEITKWLAEQLGVAAHHQEPIQRGGNKRIANRAMRESGFVCRYQDYKAGFTPLLDDFKSQQRQIT